MNSGERLGVAFLNDCHTNFRWPVYTYREML
jgi:hypothetical protein